MAVRTWSGSVSGAWSTAGNWVQGSVPVNGDEVYIPAGSAAITSGLDQSAVTLDWLEIEDGYQNNIGTSAGYLQVGVAAAPVLSPSSGSQWLDFGSSNVNVEVRKSGSAATGARAINIIGSNLATVSVQSGSVAIAGDTAKTATVATVRAYGGNIWIGQGVTLTTLNNLGANVTVDCAATTLNMLGGTTETRYVGAVTTANLYDGTFYCSSSGTVTTVNAYGGTIDSRRSGVARTISTLALYANRPVTLKIDPAAVTITTFTRPSVLYSSTFQVSA